MAKFVGELFWERVDEVKGDKSLRGVCLGNGISYDTIKQARMNKRMISLENTVKLADALGTTADYLMGGETPETKSTAEPEDEKLQELISLCKENPKLIDTLLSVAHITLGK